jgi:hypothetical protein
VLQLCGLVLHWVLVLLVLLVVIVLLLLTTSWGDMLVCDNTSKNRREGEHTDNTAESTAVEVFE